VVVFVALSLQQVYGSYWDMPWSAIHERPVFRVEPSIKWTFMHIPTATYGKVVINDDTGDILLANAASNSPLFFIINKHGQEVFSWNATASPQAQCSGVITHRRDVVYAFSDNTCELFAVSVPSGDLLWNNTELCPEDPAQLVATPITWLKNDTVMLIVTKRRIFTVRASDGMVLMNYGPLASASLMPPISSMIDDKFIFHTANDTVFKIDVETGQVEWSTDVSAGSPARSDLPPPPAVDEDGSIYVPTYSGLVHKLLSNGTLVWTTEASLNLAGTQNAPILINSTHILVTTGYTNMYFYVVQKADGQMVQVYPDSAGGFLYDLTPTRAQPLWNKNVLYAVIANGEVGAWDTTDLTGLKFLWRKNLTQELTYSFVTGGPSIMKDGTIIVATSYPSALAALVAIGCPDGMHISSDGLQCICQVGNEVKNDTCVQCPSTQVSNGTACQVCQAGKVPNNDQSDCSLCPPNTFSREGDVTCSPCSEDPSNDQCFVEPSVEPVSSPSTVSTPSKKITSVSSSLVITLPMILVTQVLLGIITLLHNA
jgi:outer membrane protein assembly factor BamB